MQRNYCYLCGHKVHADEDGIWLCEHCGQSYYDNPKPCVELALFNEAGELLLTKRAREPSKGLFDLPGGFIDMHENAEQAIRREMQEELGLRPEHYSTPHYVLSYLMDYPWGKLVYQNVIMEFTARLHPDAVLQPADDVAAVRWIDPKQIRKHNLASKQYLTVVKELDKFWRRFRKLY